MLRDNQIEQQRRRQRVYDTAAQAKEEANAATTIAHMANAMETMANAVALLNRLVQDLACSEKMP